MECAVVIPSFTLQGNGLDLRPFDAQDAAELLSIQRVNREAFAPFMPLRSETFFSMEGQQAQIAADQARWETDLGYAFAVCRQGTIVGRIALSNVVRGAWLSATLGYWVDARSQGQGIATEAVKLAARAAFTKLDLHRLQAAIMPRNAPSLRVIQKAGFVPEGLAPYYLQIHGVWEDHQIFSLTRELWDDPAQ